jgi:predicted nucleic-acid-binding Zn-ribbon protein
MLSSSSLATPEPSKKLIVWDIDDTLWNLTLGEFKNPSLLLPIMIYIAHTPNLLSAICTNRRTRDEKPIQTDPSLNDILSELERFSSPIHSELIVTLNDVKEGLDLIQHEHGQAAQEHKRAHPDALPLEASPSILGKNFQLNRLHNVANMKFQSILEKSDIILVDDNKYIVQDCTPAGYTGIKATDPFDTEILSTSMDYLYDLAHKIGLTAYIKDIYTKPELHRTNSTLQKIAALLFGLNAQILTTDHLEERLSQCFSENEIGSFALKTLDNLADYFTRHADISISQLPLSKSATTYLEREHIQNDATSSAFRRQNAPNIISNLNKMLAPFTRTARTAASVSSVHPTQPWQPHRAHLSTMPRTKSLGGLRSTSSYSSDAQYVTASLVDLSLSPTYTPTFSTIPSTQSNEDLDSLSYSTSPPGKPTP